MFRPNRAPPSNPQWRCGGLSVALLQGHDPRLLIHLKSYRNTVAVPRHWCHKRKYLQGKRGVEKKPWQLPEFIAQTGPAPRPSSDFERQGNGDDSENIQTVIPV